MWRNCRTLLVDATGMVERVFLFVVCLFVVLLCSLSTKNEKGFLRDIVGASWGTGNLTFLTGIQTHTRACRGDGIACPKNVVPNKSAGKWFETMNLEIIRTYGNSREKATFSQVVPRLITHIPTYPKRNYRWVRHQFTLLIKISHNCTCTIMA